MQHKPSISRTNTNKQHYTAKNRKRTHFVGSGKGPAVTTQSIESSFSSGEHEEEKYIRSSSRSQATFMKKKKKGNK
jgi:hypothetical protein